MSEKEPNCKKETQNTLESVDQPTAPDEAAEKPKSRTRNKRNVICVPLRDDFRDHKGKIVEAFEWYGI